jgi:hypothetical protein
MAVVSSFALIGAAVWHLPLRLQSVSPLTTLSGMTVKNTSKTIYRFSISYAFVLALVVLGTACSQSEAPKQDQAAAPLRRINQQRMRYHRRPLARQFNRRPLRLNQLPRQHLNQELL